MKSGKRYLVVIGNDIAGARNRRGDSRPRRRELFRDL